MFWWSDNNPNQINQTLCGWIQASEYFKSPQAIPVNWQPLFWISIGACVRAYLGLLNTSVWFQPQRLILQFWGGSETAFLASSEAFNLRSKTCIRSKYKSKMCRSNKWSGIHGVGCVLCHWKNSQSWNKETLIPAISGCDILTRPNCTVSNMTIPALMYIWKQICWHLFLPW